MGKKKQDPICPSCNGPSKEKVTALIDAAEENLTWLRGHTGPRDGNMEMVIRLWSALANIKGVMAFDIGKGETNERK